MVPDHVLILLARTVQMMSSTCSVLSSMAQTYISSLPPELLLVIFSVDYQNSMLWQRTYAWIRLTAMYVIFVTL